MDAAVDRLFEKIMTDPKLRPIFVRSDVKIEGVKRMQKSFLTLAFGGPTEYTGRSLRQAHHDKDISAADFDAVCGHLSATLEELGVPMEEHDEAMAIAASTRVDIVAPAPLFERLGGEPAVEACVEKMYDRIATDPVLQPIFSSIDLRALKRKQRQFLTMAFGGPAQFRRRSLQESHAGRGITETHFGAVAGHLSAVMRELDVPNAERREVIAVVIAKKDEIIGVETSLFERLGGGAAVEAAVERLNELVAADASLQPRFASVELGRLKRMQKEFLTMVFGGPSKYMGRALKAAHQDKGITKAHFDAFVGHLQTAMRELDIPEPEIGEILAIADSIDADVVGR